MKKLAIVCLALAALAGCRKKLAPGEFLVEGRLGEWSAPAKAYLGYYTDQGEVTDSVELMNGRFEFRGRTEWPVMARLIVDYSGKGMRNAMGERAVKMFYIVEGLTTVESADSLQNATVASAVNDEFEKYQASLGGSFQDLTASMNARFAAATDEQRADTAFVNGMDAEYRALIQERFAKQREYARANPASFFSVVALSESSSGDIDPDEVGGILSGLDPRLQEAPDAVALKQRIDALRNIVVGAPAPDFTQNTVDGRPVSLSDFRGRYVLLDFWASWCGPCRAESPFLVRAIDAYGARGFDVLGVSLDKEADRGAWIEAMEDDGYTWTNISDLKGWGNEAARLYGVRAIPQNYLIDPQGVILASNLRGEALLQKLAELFGE